MKKRLLMLMAYTGLMACASPASIDILSVEHHSIQVGVEQGEQFSLRENRVFTPDEKMTVKIKVVGLKVQESKIKLNVDLTLKQEGLILGLQPNIFGAKGFEKSVEQVDGFTESEVDLGVVAPANFIGDFIAQITIKDQFADIRLFTFEIPFTIAKS